MGSGGWWVPALCLQLSSLLGWDRMWKPLSLGTPPLSAWVTPWEPGLDPAAPHLFCLISPWRMRGAGFLPALDQ